MQKKYIIKRGLSPFLGTIPFLLFFIFCFTTSIKAEQGLASWWKFDEGDGEVLHDSSGNKNDGKIYGAKWVKDNIRFCLQFDGNSYVDCGNNKSLQISGPLTISTWVKISSLDATGTVISKSGWMLYFDKAKPIFISRDEYDTEGNWIWLHPNKTLPVNEWIYLTIVYNFDRQIMNFYINAQPVCSIMRYDGGIGKIYQFDLNFGRENLYYQPPQTYFTGFMAETKIYNRALSNKEIINDYLSKTKIERNSKFEFLEKYMEYVSEDLGVPGDKKTVTDEEAVGGYARHMTEETADFNGKEGVHVWWTLHEILKPGDYKVYIRAKGKGTFTLVQVNAKTDEVIKVFDGVKIDSDEYKVYFVGEIKYEGGYSLRLTDQSSINLWIDYIFLTPANVEIQ